MSDQLPSACAPLVASLLDALPDALAIIDASERVWGWNEAMARLIGVSGDEVRGRALAEIEPLASIAGAIRRALAGGCVTETSAPTSFRGERPIVFDLRCDALRRGEEVYAAIVVLRTHDQRALESALIEHSERLQQQIGQDLHDGLGQLLTGIAFLARSLASAVEPAHVTEASRIAELANDAVLQAKMLSKGFSPIHVEHRGLVDVLGELARQTEQIHRLPCRFEADDGFEGISADARRELFLIAREAITNAVQHGDAKSLRIRVGRRGHMNELVISDDGRGVRREQAGHGLGLHSMLYRARRLGGALEVVAEHPTGTTVRCFF